MYTIDWSFTVSPRFRRLGAYIVQRMGEPTSYVGVFLIAHALFGVTLSTEKQSAIQSLGEAISGMLMFAAREGRNKADNPTLSAVVKGELPPPKPAIVPPVPTSTMDTVAIDPKHVPIDAVGELHADPKSAE